MKNNNWHIEPTLFMNSEEVVEATEWGYLNFDEKASLVRTKAFGYEKCGVNKCPAIFHGGGEQDRPNHQGLGQCLFEGREHIELIRNAVYWSDIREKYKPKELEWYELPNAFPILCWVWGTGKKSKTTACVIDRYNETSEYKFKSNTNGIWSNAEPVVAEDL